MKKFIIAHLMIFALFGQTVLAVTMVPFLVHNADGTFSLVCNNQSYQKQDINNTDGTPDNTRIDCFTCSTNNYSVDLLISNYNPSISLFVWDSYSLSAQTDEIVRLSYLQPNIRAPPIMLS